MVLGRDLVLGYVDPQGYLEHPSLELSFQPALDDACHESCAWALYPTLAKIPGRVPSFMAMGSK